MRTLQLTLGVFIAQRHGKRCLNANLPSLLGKTGRYARTRGSSLLSLQSIYEQSSLDIAPSAISVRSAHIHQRSATISASPRAISSPLVENSPTMPPNGPQQQQAMLAHVEQVRMLILGMEQRLQTREEKLVKTVERAESEGRKFEEVRKEVMVNS